MRIDPLYVVIFPLLFSIFILTFKRYCKLLSMINILFSITIISTFFMTGDYDFYVSKFSENGIHISINFSTKLMLLMVSIVFLSIILNSLEKDYNHNFYFFSSVFLSAVNAAMISYDLFNIYVVIELASLTAYLLIGYRKKTVQLWASLKYLILSSVALNFYLLGTGLVYSYNKTFDISKIEFVPKIAMIFIFIGLLAKSGVFFMSMWLPLAHSEAETEVSAMLSGIFVKLGAFQIIKLLSTKPFSTAQSLIFSVAVISSILGIIYAFSEKNAKKILAYSTLSQMGFVLSGTSFANILHAFNHGIFKSLLFLTVGDTVEESRIKNFYRLRSTKLPFMRNLSLRVACFGIMGVPFFSGFVSKTLIDHELSFEGKLGLIIAATGTVATLWRFLSFKSLKVEPQRLLQNLGYSILIVFIVGVGIYGAFKTGLFDVLKSTSIIISGVLIYKFIKPLKLPKIFEKLDNALFLYIIFGIIGLIFLI